jgi:thiamine kinase-like enzyme
VRHVASFFQPKADLALREVEQISVPLTRRLAHVLDCYDRLVEVLGNQPRTLVHGSYRPANILVDITAEPMRICPIDWEMAAIGSVLYDLAFLTEGFPPLVLDQFLEAYRQEAVAYGLDVPDREEIRHVVICFHYFMKIHLLSRTDERKLSEEKVAKIIQQLEHLHHITW